MKQETLNRILALFVSNMDEALNTELCKLSEEDFRLLLESAVDNEWAGLVSYLHNFN